MLNIFISYSGDFGRKIAEHLQEALPRIAGEIKPRRKPNVFVANRDIHAGAHVERKIWENLRKCNCFLFVVTGDANRSQYAQNELGGAFALYKNIIPILAGGMSPKDMPELIHNVQAVPLDMWDSGETKSRMTQMMRDIIAANYKRQAERRMENEIQKSNADNEVLARALLDLLENPPPKD